MNEISHAISSFYHRVVPKLMLSATTEIQDSLEDVSKYIASQVDFVHNMANGNGINNILQCPFQFDACIAFNNVKVSQIMVSTKNNDEDDDDLDDDDDDDDDGKAENSEFIDCFGNIKEKLKAEQCLHKIGTINDDQKGQEKQDAARLVRAYKMQFESFKTDVISKKYKSNEYDHYPQNHRFCSIIDRRKKNEKKGTTDNDELFFYEPPNNCNTIPNGGVPLWYFDSSVCFI